MNRKLAAHLETGRVSNLPTVWSNIFMAFCLAGAHLSLHNLAYLLLAGSCLYVGGCYLGDAKDVAFDAKNKPTRPIPSGVLRASTVWVIGGLLMLTGLAAYTPSYGYFGMLYGPLPLGIAIFAYAMMHKSIPCVGLPLIGACRALLIFSAYLVALPQYNISFEVHYPPVAIAAGAMFLYTFCFASVARLESSDKKVSAPNILRIVMLSLPLCSLLYRQDPMHMLWLFIVSYLIYATWLCFAFLQVNTNKGAYVSKCLAGFALLDAVLVSEFGITSVLICLALFLLAVIFQRVAPAT